MDIRFWGGVALLTFKIFLVLLLSNAGQTAFVYQNF